MTRTGVASFRFDYRLNGRRETLVIGQYDSSLGMRKPRESEVLNYGMSVTLAEARILLVRAHRSIEQGESPSRAKAEKRAEAAEVLTFGKWAEKYFAEAVLADIFREHGPAWREGQRGHLSLGQLKVISAITQCRTAALGGHVLRCDGCGTDQVS